MDADAPNAKADAKVDESNHKAADNKSDSGTDEEDGDGDDDGQMKKKPKKEKVGFRDRKVSLNSILLNNCIYSIMNV